MGNPILEVTDLTMRYTTRAGEVSAVENVSFSVGEGEALGIVGESGSGKTSIAICLMKLLPENAHILGGQICLRGTDLAPMSEEEIRQYRWCQIAMVFQAAMNSLNPVYCVGDQIIEALQTHNPDMNNAAARARVVELFELVGLDPGLIDCYPHQYSGGMRQRAVIAMALSCNPDIIIADEPTTALDVIVQDTILRKMRDLQARNQIGMIYISHDIAVIAEVSDRIAIMYAGRIMEIASAKDIFQHPTHPYTYALMNAFPSIIGKKHPLLALPGEPPDLLHPPDGCRFHPRCPHVLDRCRREVPPDTDYGHGHLAACWNPMGKPS